MSSGQWEVVGKNKKDKQNANGKIKVEKEDKTQETPLKGSPTPEVNKDKKQKSKSGKENKANNLENKPKSQPKKSNEKKNEAVKTKIPKNLDGALQSLNADEIETFIATNKARFINAPLVWLKELATYLNQKTTVAVPEDVPAKLMNPPSFLFNQINGRVKSVLQRALSDAGPANIASFYESTLTAITHDMSRDLCSWGHLILMQLMAKESSQRVTNAISKCLSLKGSYINQPPIYISLLWSVGQIGYSDLSAGIKVWQELMSPIMDMKKFNKFCVAYLNSLLDYHFESAQNHLSHEQFLYLSDDISSKIVGSSNKEISNDLTSQYVKIRELYFKRKPNKVQVTFNQLMKKLSPQTGKSIDACQRHILTSLCDCLVVEDSCHLTWRQLYNRCPNQNVMLLEYIASNPNQLISKLNKKSLTTTLITFQSNCEEALKAKKQDDISENILKLSKQIMASKHSKKCKKGGFPWILASFFMFFSIIGLLVAYDLKEAGGVFAKSKMGQVLKDMGALEATERFALKSAGFASRTFLWVETNAPPAWEATVNVTRPYGVLAYDIFLIARNRANDTYGNIREYVIEKAPVVHATIEQYVPGALDSIGRGYVTAKDAVVSYSSHYYAVTKDYLSTKVFIGEWAPEVLQDKTAQALNSTRTYVVNYWSWLHHQAHVYSKVN